MNTKQSLIMARSVFNLVLIFALMFGQIGQAFALSLVIYVKADATGVNNGTSWVDAYTDLQSALSVATSSDEIWVAAGTYYPTSGTDRTISFILKNGVGLYGGFAGTETLLSERDYAINITILSGDIGTLADVDDNSYHVVTGDNASDTAVLDGFTVTLGKADGDYPNNRGGGMFSNFGAPTLTNVTFSNNIAFDGGGGGMYNSGSSPVLNNVIFENNSASLGGGLGNHYSTPTLTNVTFRGNNGTVGGGMYNYNSNSVLLNVTFSNNNASLGLGGIGAGMDNTDSNPTLTNVTFNGNTATYEGGGIYNSNSNPTMTNVTLSENSASNGDGIYNQNSNPIIRNSILWGDNGNEVFNDGTSTTSITYSIIEGGFAGIGNLNLDPLLGALTDNGGFTQTMLLGAGSPAMDAGDDTACPASDQRGITRPRGLHCDMGAVEIPDITPPTVTSIVRASPNPTTATSVDFTVTFSEPVTGVDLTTDFALTTTGVVGASLSNISGSGATYTVTVNTGTGAGTIRLDLMDNDSIMDLDSNPLGGVGSNDFISGESYDVLEHWVPTGSLTYARAYHTATLLPDGKVLVVAGYNNGAVLQTAEIYDPELGTWTTTAPLNGARWQHTATLLPNGRVLVAGGSNDTNGTNPISSAEVYDPVANTWTSAAPMLNARFAHTATLLPSGTVLIAGGYGTAGPGASAEVYDPETGTWTATAAMPNARYGHTATLLPTGKVLVAGGYGTAGPGASTELYDPATGTWTATNSMGQARYYSTATLLTDGKVLVAGGYGISGPGTASELYDPSTGTWAATGSLNQTRYIHKAALLPNGKVLVAGGHNGSIYLASAELYDPAAGTWTTTASVATARTHPTITLLPNGQALLIGGVGSDTVALASAELYGVAPLQTNQTITVTTSAPASATSGATFTVAATASSGLPVSYSSSGSCTNSGADFTITSGAGNCLVIYNQMGDTSYNAAPTLTETVTDAGESPVITEGTSVALTISQDGNPVPFVLTLHATDPDNDTLTWSISTPASHGNASASGTGLSKAISYTPTLDYSGADSFDVQVSDGGLSDTITVNVTIEDGWVVTGSMAQARYNYTAILLANGKVLVIGGTTGGYGSALASAEVYDPEIGTWATTGSMNQTRVFPTVSLLANGKVLVAGGQDGVGSNLASAELYDPITGTWTATDSMNSARHFDTATLLSNGQVLVAGGFDGNSFLTSAELYDPATGIWTATGSMNLTHYAHTATLLANGQVLVAGGYNNGGIASAELYDPITGTWTTTGSMNQARFVHDATLLPNGKVLVVGGHSGSSELASVELYDPATGTWTTTGATQQAYGVRTVALLANGKVLAAGGINNVSGLASAELYDPATGTWVATGSMNQGRYSHTVTLLPNGQVLVAGGAQNSSPFASAELYGVAPTRVNQTISVTTSAPASASSGDTFSVAATSSSGLPVSYSSSGSCTNAGADFTITSGAGNCLVIYNQMGDTSYNAAPTVTETVADAGELPVITEGSSVARTISQDGNPVPFALTLHATDPDNDTLTWSISSPASHGNASASGTGLSKAISYTPTLDYSGSDSFDVQVSDGGLSDTITVNVTIEDGWVLTGSMAAVRYGHTTTLLPNGKVLVVGGYSSSGILASVELYDPATGTWTTTGTMAQARTYHTATLLPNGKVLVVGGAGNSGNLVSAELYDPATGTWAITGSMNQARQRHTAILLPNGKVLIAGGYNSGILSSAELYDSATGTWMTTGSLNQVRYYHTATLLANGKVLVAGGSYSSVLSSTELYDPVTGTWAITSSMNQARYSHTATLLANGKVLVSGGSNSSFLNASAELYDPATDIWTFTSSLNQARTYHAATLLANGKVLVTGGYGTSVSTSAELYDPASGAWATTSPMNQVRLESHTATLLPNGQVLVTGGHNGSILASAELYGVAPSRTNHTITVTISAPANAVNGASFTVAATASSGLPVFYSSSGSCTNVGAVFTMNAVTTGDCLVVYNQMGDLSYNAAPTVVETVSDENDTPSITESDPRSVTMSQTGTPIPFNLTLNATDPDGDTLTWSILTPAQYGVASASGTGLSKVIGYAPNTTSYYGPDSFVVQISDGTLTDSITVNVTVHAIWIPTGSMTISRYIHTATLLPNGKVLVTAGLGNGTLTSAELYDPATGTWGTAGALAQGRWFHTATLLSNGKVLITGGIGSGLETVSSAEIYDPATGNWTSTGSMNTARFSHKATLLPNGKVLVTGGANNDYLASAELYDPTTGTWTTINSMANARGYHTATLLSNGKVLVTSGLGNGGVPGASAEIYDPASGAWSSAGALASARYSHMATLLPDGRVLVTGGYNGSSLSGAEIYNPATNTWTSTGGMMAGRTDHTATLLPNGKVLVAGGSNGGNILSSAELYDPGTGLWTNTTSLATARAYHTATLAPNGQVLVVGGSPNGGGLLASAELYGVVVPRINQTVSVTTGAPASALAGATFTVSATSSSGLPVSYSSAGVCTNIGANFTMTSGTGTCTVKYNQAGNWDYNPAPQVTETVIGLNSVPVITEGSSVSRVISQDNSPIPFNLTLHATDLDGDTLTWSIATPAAHGTASASGVGLAKSIGYSPTLDYSGTDSFIVQVSDGVSTDTITVNVTIEDGWAMTGSLGHNRVYQTITLLPNGKVLVAGGLDASINAMSGAELYDPATGVWSFTGSMNQARWGATAILLSNGKVLVAGGHGTSGAGASAELYDPSTGTWTSTGSMTSARYFHTATLLPNGKVLVMGGNNGSNSIASAELYDPATGTWTPTSSMNAPRTYHTTTLLPNGKVLVTGGDTLASAELYDPATGIWTLTGTMQQGRSYQTASLLPNGKVLIAGGYNGGTWLSSAELYDPADGTWLTVGSMSQAHVYHTATLLPNGKVLVAGGYNGSSVLASAELFNPATGTWGTTGPMNIARYYHTSIRLPNGQVLTVGGFGSGPILASAELYGFPPVRTNQTITINTNAPLSAVNGASFTVAASATSGLTVSYSSSGSCTNVGPNFTMTSGIGTCKVIYNQMGNPAYNAAPALMEIVADANDAPIITEGGSTGVTVSQDGAPTAFALTLHATDADGQTLAWSISTPASHGNANVSGTGLSKSISYTPVMDYSGADSFVVQVSDGTATDTIIVNVTIEDGWVFTGSLTQARHAHTVTLLPNGRVLSVGGYDNGVFGSAELYDPITAAWTNTGALAVERYTHSATLLPNGKVLVTGGYNGVWLSSVELYDPATGSWTNTGTLNTARSVHTATLLPNGKVLVTGGYNGVWLSSAELYDPATGTWTTTGSLSQTRYYHTATLLPNGKVLVTGGYNNTSNWLSSAELYDPTTGIWTAASSLVQPRYLHEATLLPNGKVLVTGGYGNGGALASAELYDPTAGTWTAASSLAQARYYHSATLLPNGKVLVAGGYVNSSSRIASAELYDPATNIWMPMSTLSQARGRHIAILAPNGQVLAVGGFGSSASLASSELYGVAPIRINQTIVINVPAPLSAGNGTSFTVSATVTSGLSVTYSSSGSCTNAGANFTMTSETGTCTVIYDQSGNWNYNPAPQLIENVTAHRPIITVTADAQNKVYGNPDPAFTYTYSGFVGSDGSSDIDTPPTCTVTGAHVNAGNYAIICSGGVDDFYDFVYVNGMLTITAKPITVTADPQSKVYGIADPALSYQVTSGALESGDNFTGSLTRVSGENVGTYAISQGTLTAGSNYNLTFIGNNLMITAKPITVTADAKSKVYGSADPALTYQITSGALESGDNFTGTLTRDSGDDVGAYAITQGTLTAGSNYNLTFVGDDLTITEKTITVTADPKTKVFSSADPVLSYAFTPALESGDSFTGALTRTAGENVGTYSILQGSLALNSNYNLAYVSANLTITAPSDLIFANGFESGNLSAWSASVTDADDLSVASAATMAETLGLQAVIDDNTSIYVTDNTPNAEPRYRARFYFDPNSITMTNGNAHFLLYGYSVATQVLRIEFQRAAGLYQLRTALRNDGAGWTSSAWFTITDDMHFIELDWRASSAVGANNGGLTFWIDGVQQANLTGVDNDTRRIDSIQLGAVAGIDTATRGTYYFDAFESRRLMYIGPDPNVVIPPPLPDLIFANGFETGNLSAWSVTSDLLDSSDPSTNAGAALIGSLGMQINVNNNNAVFITDNAPTAESRYRARFYFDPNSITMTNGNAHYLFYGNSGTAQVIRIEFRRSSGVYQLRAALRDDATGWTTSGWFTITDAAHSIEIDWRAATAVGANDGGLTFWIDGVQQANLTGVDNDTRRIDSVQLGAVAGIDTATRGTYYFDAFESRRQTYIGP